MMREILFRGKLTDNGVWVYGDYVKVIKFDNSIAKHCIVENKSNWDLEKNTSAQEVYCVDPETVGQFTGLYSDTKWDDLTDVQKKQFYDKVCYDSVGNKMYDHIFKVRHLWKGEKIFEGDIVRAGAGYHNSIFVVRFINGAFCLQYIDSKDYFAMDDSERGCTYEGVASVDVLGNIYDNPELLNVEREDGE